MKALKCEMCGSPDVVKNEGLFVCQYCGTKYTVEEAKKLMIEGTVKIDQTDELKNLYVLARRAKNDNDAENASKYYQQILLKDASCWEPNFYTVYFQSMNCIIADIRNSAIRLENSIESVLQLIKEISNDEEQENTIKEFTGRICIISEMFFTSYKGFYDNLSIQVKANYLQGYVNSCLEAAKLAYNAGNGIIDFFGEKYGLYAAQCWKQGVIEHSQICGLFDDKKKHASVIQDANEKIKKYDSDYQAPSIDMSKSGACYIATAVYGSYDCPEVWTLRRYRDYNLANSLHGRLFIRIYYRISPYFVKWFGKTKLFNAFWRRVLDKKINHLHIKGYQSLPYQDK